jgi:hypothetical protein
VSHSQSIGSQSLTESELPRTNRAHGRLSGYEINPANTLKRQWIHHLPMHLKREALLLGKPWPEISPGRLIDEECEK